MKKFKFNSISQTEILTDAQLDEIEAGGACEQCCKKGCPQSKRDGYTQSEPVTKEQRLSFSMNDGMESAHIDAMKL